MTLKYSQHNLVQHELKLQTQGNLFIKQRNDAKPNVKQSESPSKNHKMRRANAYKIITNAFVNNKNKDLEHHDDVTADLSYDDELSKIAMHTMQRQRKSKLPAPPSIASSATAADILTTSTTTTRHVDNTKVQKNQHIHGVTSNLFSKPKAFYNIDESLNQPAANVSKLKISETSKRECKEQLLDSNKSNKQSSKKKQSSSTNSSSTDKETSNLDDINQNLAVCIQEYGTVHPRTSSALIRLGDYYMKKQNYSQALKLFQDALEIKRQFPHEEKQQIGIAFALDCIATAALKCQDYDLALKTYQNAFYTRYNLMSNDSKKNIALCNTLNNIAGVYLLKNNLKKSYSCFRKVLRIQLDFCCDEYASIAKTLVSLGNVAMRLSLFDESYRYYARAFRIYKKNLLLSDYDEVILRIQKDMERIDRMGRMCPFIYKNEDDFVLKNVDSKKDQFVINHCGIPAESFEI